ncbi:MAG TPA: hypothetical protein VFJ98_00375 [Mycobacteriales bacterium]|nr:hypothetical protein [Mycobacteriales bacterium]
MDAVRRLPLPLVVAGVALVVGGLRGGGPAPAAGTGTSYVPPVATAAAAAAQAGPVRVTRRPHELRSRPRAARVSARLRAARPAQPAPAARPAHSPPPPASRPAATAPADPAHRPRVASGPTGWAQLDAAIARIPSYRAGTARWVVSTKYDFWGTADWYHDVLYVDPGVPADKLYDVAVHEWSHELSVLDYGGDVLAATRAMNLAFGGHGLTGAERAADCMAILQGATWTHYTTCTAPAWRAAAARLVAGHRL